MSNWFKKATKSVSKAATSTVNTVAKETTKVVDTVATTTVNTANTVAKETTKAVNVAGKAIVDTTGKVTAEGAKFAEDTANSIAKESVSAANQVKVTATKGAMATANVAAAAMNDIEAGSKLALQGMEQAGSYAVEAGELVAEWAEANYCQIGVSVALGTIFAALLYRPEPTSVATTTAATAPLSGTAILYLAAKETVGAAAMGTACDLTAGAFVELIWMSSDVRKAIGNKNKQILTDAIAFTLAKSIDKAAGAMIIPQSCAAVVAGIVTTLVAQLACEQTLPSGAREWASTGASGL
mgnify:CR=1 FL=1|tara:strand:- start:24 stop:914 length:891 start_codon:yes stop_codon:yes gene_type:complete